MVAEIDAIINAQVSAEEPGVAVAVIKDGELIHCKGYGLANLEWNAPTQSDTVFCLASITKQFTAAAILLLAQQGKLSIDAPITTYLPGYPTHGHEISIIHLLTHTSGIKPYNEVEGFYEQYVIKQQSHEELIALFKDLPLEFEPGTRFKYNNSGYYLLGVIIEVVTGKSYGEFVQEQIFAPLNMQHSYYMRNEAIIAQRAGGYVRTEQGFANAPYINMAVPFAGGALGSTLEDFVLWDAALRECQLLKREALERMYTPVQLADGSTAEYGFGWMLKKYRGLRVAHHGGDINGFLSFVVRFLDAGVTVILLSNLQGRDIESLLRQIIRQVFKLPPVQHEAVLLAPAALQSVIGNYTLRQGINFAVEQEDEEIVLRPFNVKLIPISETVFCFAYDHEIEVHFSDLRNQRFESMAISFPFYSWSTTRVIEA